MEHIAIKRFRQHLNELHGRQVTGEELIGILRRARLVLEAENLKSTYPTVALYADWINHTKLDRENAVSFITRIVDAVCAGLNDTHLLFKGVFEALSLQRLRSEMMQLVFFFSCRDDVVQSYSNWTAFLRAVVDEIRHRPIAVENPKIVEALKSKMKSFGQPPHCTVTSLKIIDQPVEFIERHGELPHHPYLHLGFLGGPGGIHMKLEIVVDRAKFDHD